MRKKERRAGGDDGYRRYLNFVVTLVRRVTPLSPPVIWRRCQFCHSLRKMTCVTTWVSFLHSTEKNTIVKNTRRASRRFFIFSSLSAETDTTEMTDETDEEDLDHDRAIVDEELQGSPVYFSPWFSPSTGGADKCGCVSTHKYGCTFVCYLRSAINWRLQLHKNVQPHLLAPCNSSDWIIFVPVFYS